MSNIIDAKKGVVKFLKENIKCYDLTVIKIGKVQESWSAVAEVYEDDSFLKSMNVVPPPSSSVTSLSPFTFGSITISRVSTESNKMCCKFSGVSFS